ncbi:hypothetical protein [Duganella vulcania]|uniref:Uncharacterized protein n=1 Tax=Duganella vulcania TaxID=2692166 RepID=A0A845GCE9_9BURK|nr:hypothetical protein [Duganella vulcania]MYM92283.1 hypothetical protein [Duganella vulcania]
MFKFQKLSNYGSATPAVARTLLQASPIIDMFKCSDEQKDALKEKFFDLQRHLLKCVECRDSLAAEIESERANYVMPPNPDVRARGAFSLPGVGDLQSKGDTFLQSAKLAIAATGDMVEPFYGKAFGHKFHQLEKWAKENFDPADTFVTSVTRAIPFVKRIVQMRNAVDHPKPGPGERMAYANFDIADADGKMILVDPSWALTGEVARPMLQDFDQVRVFGAAQR